MTSTRSTRIAASLRPRDYWRLWLFDTVLVTAGLLFFLATHYGTDEFFGTALVMALLTVPNPRGDIASARGN